MLDLDAGEALEAGWGRYVLQFQGRLRGHLPELFARTGLEHFVSPTRLARAEREKISIIRKYSRR